MPSADWTKSVLGAWRIYAKAGRTAFRQHGEPTPDELPGLTWMSLTQDRQGTIKMDMAERAVLMGVQLLIITHDMKTVQPMLVAVADHNFTLSPLNWTGLKQAVQQCLGGFPDPAEIPGDDVCAAGHPVHAASGHATGPDRWRCVEAHPGTGWNH